MFTGLVADLGEVTAVDATGDGVRLAVRTRLAPELSEGDSVAVNGVCLTADARSSGDRFGADVMNETLRRSSLAEAGRGLPVNLELPLRAADRLGGHFVQGHVDGVGARRATSARTASPASSRSPRPPSCCATSSRRARSPSTASP